MLANAAGDLVLAVAGQDSVVTGTWVDHVVIASCHRSIAGSSLSQDSIGKRRIAVVADDYVSVRSTGDYVSTDTTEHCVVAASGVNVIGRA